jgi:hypothetical protein
VTLENVMRERTRTQDVDPVDRKLEEALARAPSVPSIEGELNALVQDENERHERFHERTSALRQALRVKAREQARVDDRPSGFPMGRLSDYE